MNRKATRDQNDISIIIGNLPKRLQDKIIIREGSSTISNTASSSGSANLGATNKNDNYENRRQVADRHSGAVAKEGTTAIGPHCTTDANEMAVTSIDYFLRLATIADDGERTCQEPVLETSGLDTVKSVPTQKTNADTVAGELNEIVSIPGLIRLNAENVKKLNETQPNGTSRNHERRHRHQQTRQEMLVSSARGDMPMSPVRQIPKLNHPQWFNALDDAQAKRLPTLFDALQQIINQNQVIEVFDKQMFDVLANPYYSLTTYVCNLLLF